MTQPRVRPEDIATLRGSVLGEMHRGQVYIEETHTALKKMVRLAIVCNLTCWIALWTAFRVKNLFPPHDAPFMSAIGWYFFFGAVYGGFGQMAFSFGRYAERTAVTQALTRNRSYEWHSRYDTANMNEEDLKKIAVSGQKRPDDIPPPAAPGKKRFFYAMLFQMCAFISCVLGINAVIYTLF